MYFVRLRIIQHNHLLQLNVGRQLRLRDVACKVYVDTLRGHTFLNHSNYQRLRRESYLR